MRVTLVRALNHTPPLNTTTTPQKSSSHCRCAYHKKYARASWCDVNLENVRIYQSVANCKFWCLMVLSTFSEST